MAREPASDESGLTRPEVMPPLPPLHGEKQMISIGGHELTLTNLDKVFWPEEGYTKRDLVNHYFRVSSFIVPHLYNRPLTLKRRPEGAAGDFFYQKEAPAETPAWVKRATITHSDQLGVGEYLVCNDLPTLLFLANLGCVSQNPWLSMLPDLDRPDIIALDLDPIDPEAFEQCIEVAQLVRRQLERFGLKGYPKTSGATGIHVFVPIEPRYTYAQGRQFAEIVAYLCREERPDLVTLQSSVSQRGDKLYLDYMQNVREKTLASVYSVRGRPGAPVSTPLEWHEVKKGMSPLDFTVATIPERLERTGDLFEPVLTEKQDLMAALQRGEEFLK